MKNNKFTSLLAFSEAGHYNRMQNGAGGEIQLTDAMEASLESVPMTACRFSGRRFDCGSKQGFITATVHYAKKAGFDTSGDAE